MISLVSLSNNYKMIDIVIVGAGPATLAFCARINQIDPTIKIIIFEAGKPFKQRLEDPTPENIICGWGGAALYSDRKFSATPCGSGLRDTNIYELRDSYHTVIKQLIEATKNEDTKLQFQLLDKEVESYLETNNVPMEQIKRKMEQDSKTTGLKRYPSVVLDSIEESKDIVDYYQQFISDNVTINYESTVVRINQQKDDNVVTVTDKLNTYKTYHSKYIVIATGRFGGLGLTKMIDMKDHPDWFKMGRVEFGVRLDLSTVPNLVKKIKYLQNKGLQNGSQTPDLKFKCKSQLTIEGHSIDVEYRTFCVCLSKDDTGSMVASKDIVTKLTTFSGSSSINELEERGKHEHFIEGANMGIMIRLDSSQISYELLHKIHKMCQYVSTEPMELTLDDIDNSISSLESTYPKDLTYIIYHGICQMLNEIMETTELTGTAKVYGACLEGTGVYPNIDKHTYQLKDTIFAMGDVVEHTRGLLQSMVMGDIVAKYINTHQLETGFKKTGILKPYQSLFLPSCAYGHITLSNQLKIDSTIELENKMINQLKTLSDINHPNMKKRLNAIRIRSNEIYKDLFKVRHAETMSSPNMGVIYELHNFFVDTKVYDTDTQQLHYITGETTLQYIILCNLIDNIFKSKEMKIFLLSELKRQFTAFTQQHFDDLEEQIEKTLKNHQFKSCILSLRTRESIKTRDNYIDIPVMQSAYKFIPITKKFYDTYDFNTVKWAETYIVSRLMAWIDIVVPEIIEEQNLSLAMARTKIETQEPAIIPHEPDTNPLYLECHVKVVMKTAGNEIPDYDTKSQLIQIIAEAFEGENAIEPDIFEILSVSINLLKHPDNHQQYFLTFRTHTKQEMELIRTKFKQIMSILKMDPRLNKYYFQFLTDSEFVIYDNNRPLDLGWFPSEKDLLVKGFQNQVKALTEYSQQYCFLSSNVNKVNEHRINMEKLDESKRFALIRNLRLVNKMPNMYDYDIDTYGIHKAKEGYKLSNIPVLVEITGLYLEGMKSFPGGQTKEIIEQMGLEKFAELFNGKSVTMITGLYMCNTDGTVTTSIKKTEGTIVLPRGEGWGWDSIFQPNDIDKTFGEMDAKMKNEWSPRFEVLKSIM